MKALSIAGLAGLASLGAQAQETTPPLDLRQSFDPVVVTATRTTTPTTTIRDTVVITRDELDAAGSLSLGEVLQREAGIELRSNGGPGQPQSLFIRGAGSAQTLVLVDGMRVGSATVGTTAIEHIPIDMIERIEVVKGPLSSLYGGDAMGGVIQIFTRGKNVPYFYANAGYGTDNDWRVNAGVTGTDDNSKFSLATGYRSVDAPSATDSRNAFGYNPDRDPYDDAYFNFHLSQKMWTGEMLALDAFTTNAHTHFDAGPGDDWNYHVISGAKFSSSSVFSPTWTSTLSVAEGLDRLEDHGGFIDHFETRQFQATWLNEFPIAGGGWSLGAETLRQKIYTDAADPFTNDQRNTNSVFVGVNQSIDKASTTRRASAGTTTTSSVRTTTGNLSYGLRLAHRRALGIHVRARASARRRSTISTARPSRATRPIPGLQPEQSTSYELSLRSLPRRLAAMAPHLLRQSLRRPHRVRASREGTVLNVARARTQGFEAVAETQWLGARWKGDVHGATPEERGHGRDAAGARRALRHVRGEPRLGIVHRGHDDAREQRALRFHERGPLFAAGRLHGGRCARALRFRQALVGAARRDESRRQTLRDRRGISRAGTRGPRHGELRELLASALRGRSR